MLSSSLIDRFDRQWDLGNTPDVEQFVAKHRPLTLSQLTQILLIDQSRRWTRGERVTAKAYFQKFPELLENAEAAIDLLFAEYVLSESAEPAISVESLIEPYPQFEKEFRRQIEFHRTVGAELVHDWVSADAQGGPAVGYEKYDVPGYEILHELGRGGLGVVYLARNLQLNRYVALKMLIAGRFASSSLSKRLLLEAEAIARLQHPNIVQIYDVGEFEDCPFLALEYVSGGTLAHWMGRRPQSPRDAAEITLKVAMTIQFAHEKGVVHRDLKPSNLLIQGVSGGPQGTLDLGSAGSHPHRQPSVRLPLHQIQIKVADFGLAKFVGQDSATTLPRTLTGDLMGTAAYMSPEQARGGSAKLDASTDIYSLGAILYELLTGRPPFVGVNPLEVLGQVVSEEPVRPSQLVRNVPRDLQTICLKCLEKSPARRYPTAAAMAEDLHRFLNGQPIIARRTNRWERAWRWCRRKPVETMLVAASATMLMMIAVFSSVYSVMLGNQLEITTKSERTEKALKFNALEQLWESTVSQADSIRTSRQVGQRTESLKTIEMARGLGTSIPFKPDQIDRMRNGMIASLALSDLVIKSRTQRAWPDSASSQFDSEFNLCATLNDAKEVVVQRVEDGEEMARIATDAPKVRFELSSDGRQLAINSSTFQVYGWEGKKLRKMVELPRLSVWSFSRKGDHLIGLNREGELMLIDVNLPNSVRPLGAYVGLRRCELSPDRKRMALFIDDSVQVVDVESKRVLLRADVPPSFPYHIFAWHPNSKDIALGIYPQGIEVWDTDICDKLVTLAVHGPCWFDFDASGTRLLTYNHWNHLLQLWDLFSGEIEFSQNNQVYRWIAALKEGGFRLLQLEANDRFAVAEVQCPSIFQRLPSMRTEASDYGYTDASFSQDGRFLAYYARGEIEIFDAATLRSLGKAVSPFCYLRFAPDGSLVTMNDAGTNAARQTERRLFRWKKNESMDSNTITFGPPEPLCDPDTGFATAPFEIGRDGKQVALCCEYGFKAVSLESPNVVESKSQHQDVRRVAIDARSKRVATAGWNGGNVCIWDSETGALLRTIPEQGPCLTEFSPDGSMLATVSSTIGIWDTTTWERIAKIDAMGRPSSGTAACFSPDSRCLAASDTNGRIHLFHAKTGKEFLLLKGSARKQLLSLRFSPDGTKLLALSGYAPADLWDLGKIFAELDDRDLGWQPGEVPEPQANDLLHEVLVEKASNDSGTHQVRKGIEDTQPKVLQGPSHVELLFDKTFRQWEAQYLVSTAYKAVERRQFESAHSAVTRALALEPDDPETCDLLAWLLTTGPMSLRDAEVALRLARKVCQNDPSGRPSFTNTLGVALYRTGRLQEAKRVLEKNAAIQNPEQQAFDLFFVAMCEAELNDLASAKSTFLRSEELRKKYRSRMNFVQQNELLEFSREAEVLLKSKESQGVSVDGSQGQSGQEVVPPSNQSVMKQGGDGTS